MPVRLLVLRQLFPQAARRGRLPKRETARLLPGRERQARTKLPQAGHRREAKALPPVPGEDRGGPRALLFVPSSLPGELPIQPVESAPQEVVAPSACAHPRRSREQVREQVRQQPREQLRPSQRARRLPAARVARRFAGAAPAASCDCTSPCPTPSEPKATR